MDDDVVYILDALQPQNPCATRCLAALQLAAKCMTPAFRMHVRAHGTITEFYKALRDAPHRSRGGGGLALCTACVMFVLNQDNLNMDLDRDSLALMLALLDNTSVSDEDPNTADGLSDEQRGRNAEKVREICADIKALGKANHLSVVASGPAMTAGTLAMETLLSLTAKRAGEWFKEEMRIAGGLEMLMRTVCDGCEWIVEETAAAEGSWTSDALVDRLRRVERCLRVVENVSTQNENNQRYMLQWESGLAVRQLLRFYAMCDAELTRLVGGGGAKDSPAAIVLREALISTLKVLVNLTHPFGAEASGSGLIGQQRDVFDTCLRVLLHVGRSVPEQYVFELNILVSFRLICLSNYTDSLGTNFGIHIIM